MKRILAAVSLLMLPLMPVAVQATASRSMDSGAADTGGVAAPSQTSCPTSCVQHQAQLKADLTTSGSVVHDGQTRRIDFYIAAHKQTARDVMARIELRDQQSSEVKLTGIATADNAQQATDSLTLHSNTGRALSAEYVSGSARLYAGGGSGQGGDSVTGSGVSLGALPAGSSVCVTIEVRFHVAAAPVSGHQASSPKPQASQPTVVVIQSQQQTQAQTTPAATVATASTPTGTTTTAAVVSKSNTPPPNNSTDSADPSPAASGKGGTLPDTGAGTGIASLLGSGSLGYGLLAWRRSRRALFEVMREVR